MQSLAPLFCPRRIALVGATGDRGKLAGVVMANLLRFRGEICPVTPEQGEVCGRKAYPSPADLPETVDLSLIVRPAAEVPDLLREHRGKARCCVIVSAGFAEVGAAALQAEVAAIGRELGIRLVGPNCLGVFNPRLHLDTFFLPPERLRRPRAGSLSVVSQSGAVLSLLLEGLAVRRAGVAKAVNYGNAVDIDAPEIFEYLAEDGESEVVIAYLESVGDGRRFAAAARRLAAAKPLLLLKSGRGAGGGVAAFSHTGRLAGDYAVFRSVMADCGIGETRRLEELLDAAHALARQRPSGGNRVCIVTNAGGPGVLAADECARQRLELPSLPAAVADEIRRIFPPFYSVGNPADLTGQVRDADYRAALAAVGEHYDGFLVIALAGVPGLSEELAAYLAEFRRVTAKPVVACITQGRLACRLIPRLEKAGVPVLPTPERAVRALRMLLVRKTAASPELVCGEGSSGGAVQALRSFLSARPGRRAFLEPEVKAMLRSLGIESPPALFLPVGTSPPEALGLSFPLVAKVAAEGLAAKSEAGGVRLSITDRAELVTAVADLRSIDGAAGVFVEEQAPPGLEVIVGGVVDPQFGPLVMFGLGGVFVELLRDVSFALAPLDREGALRLIERTRGAELLAAFRGRPPLDREALARVVVTVSALIGSGLLAEIDLNPVVVYPSGVLVLDTKMVRPGGEGGGRE